MTTDKPRTSLVAWAASESLGTWVDNKSAGEFDVIEFDDTAAYLDHILRRNPKTGARERTPIRIVAPGHTVRCKARIDALKWVQSMHGMKNRPNWEEACSLLGAVYVDELDTVCIVARCTRDFDAPQHQHLVYDELDKRYGRGAILDLWARICQLDAYLDPRVHEVPKEEFTALVDRIAEVRSISPLAGMSGGAQSTFIVTMASQLRSLRTPKAS